MIRIKFNGVVMKVVAGERDIYQVERNDILAGCIEYGQGMLSSKGTVWEGNGELRMVVGYFAVALSPWYLRFDIGSDAIRGSAYSRTYGMSLNLTWHDRYGHLVREILSPADLGRIPYEKWDRVSFSLVTDPGQPLLEAGGERIKLPERRPEPPTLVPLPRPN